MFLHPVTISASIASEVEYEEPGGRIAVSTYNCKEDSLFSSA